jgi:hypothetical protein
VAQLFSLGATYAYIMTATLSIVIGVLTSATASFIFIAARWLRLRRLFADLDGIYEVHTIAPDLTDKIVENEKLRLQYEGGSFFTTRCTGGPSGAWTGTVSMREENPYCGEGTFKYDDKCDFGVHHVQINPDRLSIYVRVITYACSDQRAIGLVWRRCADQGGDQARHPHQRAEQDGPASGSQPICSETNRTSPRQDLSP